jgi:cell division protein FtsI (penicillin-binding protein 3)
MYMLGLFLLLWTGAIAARLVNLQIVQYGALSQRAARQQQRSAEVAPRRGVVYDRNGQELAMSISVDSVFAVPSEIPDQANAANLLAGILKAPPQEVLAKLESSRNFVWIARKLDADTANRIRSLNLKGVNFQKESKRFYPKRELAAQVLGYVGMDDEGLGGIERSYDEKLRGKPGKMLVSVDARNKGLGRVEKQPEPGSSIVLTLDEKIQYIAERELDRSLAETHSEAGIVVVQNPYTGEVLALASRPGVDPNDLGRASTAALKNRAVSDAYEPGSTFKIITIAAALEEKLTRPEEVIDCQMGAITIFGHTIHDHKPFGDLTVSQIMQKSSDVGAIKVGLRLGEQRFDQYIRSFGFGAQTGIELPGETRGMFKPVTRWTKSSIGSISMGQEIGVTALQVAAMTSAIANDGIYTAPRVVAGTIAPHARPGAETVAFHPAASHRVVSPMTAAQMRRMLEDTVLFGTGKKAILDGYTSAGKTGTAQKVDPTTHLYSRRNLIASFTGFAPVTRPAITVYAMLDSPQGSHHGGDVAAPLFNRIAQQVLEYMNVPHDADIRSPQRRMLRAAADKTDLGEGTSDRLDEDAIIAEADSTPLPVELTSASAPNPKNVKVLQASFSGPLNTAPMLTEARLVAAAPEPARSPTPTNGTVILDSENGPLTPSFLGKSVRGAIETAQRQGLEIEVVGSGVARNQSPAPGQPLQPGGRVVIRFER